VTHSYAQSFTQPCTVVHSRAQLCTVVHSQAQSFAQLCTVVHSQSHSFAQSCTVEHSFAQSCTVKHSQSHSFAQSCTAMHSRTASSLYCTASHSLVFVLHSLALPCLCIAQPRTALCLYGTASSKMAKMTKHVTKSGTFIG
jgi:hypothetical protein